MNERDFTLLNDYFNDLLSPEAAQAVERRAAEDAEFGQAFELYQKMAAYPRRAAQRQAFSDQLAAVGKDFFNEKNKTLDMKPAMTAKVSRMKWLAAAASLALLAAAVWFFTRSDEPSYRQYARHAPLSLTVRGATEQAAARAESAFNAGEYADALSALDSFLLENADDSTALFYKGICLIELGRTAEARAIFEPMANGASAFRSEAKWCIALSYLKDNDLEACRSALLRIKADEYCYQDAQQLLQDLGQRKIN